MTLKKHVCMFWERNTLPHLTRVRCLYSTRQAHDKRRIPGSALPRTERTIKVKQRWRRGEFERENNGWSETKTKRNDDAAMQGSSFRGNLLDQGGEEKERKKKRGKERERVCVSIGSKREPLKESCGETEGQAKFKPSRARLQIPDATSCRRETFHILSSVYLSLLIAKFAVQVCPRV